MYSQTTRTLSGGRPSRLGDLVADAPDELRRDVDDELVALPVADRLVRLHRVVRARSACGRSPRRRRRPRRSRARRRRGRACARSPWSCFCATASSGSSIGSSTSYSTSSERERRARLAERVGGDGGDRLALVVRLARRACRSSPGSSTARTPGASRARDASRLFTRARACGERSTAVCSIPGSAMSAV